MDNWIALIVGLLITFAGFRAYKYFDSNLDTINNKPGKLFALATTIIMSGFILVILSIVNMIKS